MNAQSSCTKLVMLGTGTPVANPKRAGASIAVIAGQEPYLFDFGVGVVRNAAALTPEYGGNIPELHAGRLKTAFLTHLHSDHTLGFPDLLLSGWTSGRRDSPLRVFGPDGVQDLVAGVLSAWKDDIDYRRFGMEGANDRGWRVDVTPISQGEIYSDDNIRVIAFPVIHGTWPNAFGFRIETADKIIVLAGDLSPCDSLLAYGQGADYLVHEVYCQRGYEHHPRLTAILRSYHRLNHTSTHELAEIATKLRPKTLILNHILWFGCSSAEVLDEISERYDGKVVLAEDLDVFD
ncbi:MAG: MBL fold metallo-hydrolase [Pseudomonadota bacterium]